MPEAELIFVFLDHQVRRDQLLNLLEQLGLGLAGGFLQHAKIEALPSHGR